jgi:hypothetical protein
VIEPSVNFGTATCGGGSCGWSCNAAFLKCPGTSPVCTRKIWDFEDGTTQGHFLRTDTDVAQTAVVNTSAQVHGGSHSLALPLRSSGGYVDINLTICAGSSVRLPTAPRTISAWYFIEGALDTNATLSNYLSIGIWGCFNNGCTIANASANPPVVGAWRQIVSPVPADFARDWPDTDGYTLSGTLHPTGSGTTTLYIDDIVLQ